MMAGKEATVTRTVTSPIRALTLVAVLITALTALGFVQPAHAQHERNPGADFPGWSQDFSGDADEWLDLDDDWCGSFELVPADEGELTPTAGSGYARVAGGECVEQFAEDFEPSGPYSGNVAMSDAWPEGGFVEELDLYLDPEQHSGFDYYLPLSLYDVREAEGFPPSVRYTRVQVTEQGDALSVGGHPVEEAGWYTFRHRFTEDEDGSLRLDFELVDADGEQVGSHTLEEHFGPSGLEDPEPLEVSADNVGNAYIWFHMPFDEAVAIDRYEVRRGD